MSPLAERLRLLLIPSIVVAGLCAWVAWQQPVRDVAVIRQERLDVAGPPLAGGRSLSQTFLSSRSGLQAVELMLVAHQPEIPLPAGTEMVLTLARAAAAREVVARVSLSLAGRRHNDVLRFSFAPLDASSGVIYRMTLTAAGEAPVSVWHTPGDAYADGEMYLDGRPLPGDLYFRTHHAYTGADAAREAATLAWRGLRYLPALILVALPGWALALLMPLPSWLDGWGRAALVVALALSFWALLFLWAGTTHLRLTNTSAWALAAAAVMGGSVAVARGRRVFAPRGGPRRERLVDVVLGLVLLLVAATRILHVRDLAVPNWVDSVHHSVLTELLVRQGGVPWSFEPFFPVDALHYHFGYHAAAAALSWYGGLAAHQAVLLLGQVLNALAPLVAYTLTVWLLRRRWAGVAAAVVAGALSYMPAYYASWGRYTQLAGLLMLPAVCLATAAATRAVRRGRGWPAWAALLASGLFVTHYRVLILFLLFWVAYLAYLPARRYRQDVRASLRALFWRLPLVAGLALLLTAPWVLRFATQVWPRVGSVYGGLTVTEGGTNAPSWGLLTPYWTRPLLISSAAGLVWATLRRRMEVLLLGGWVALWYLAANLRLIGLRDSWILDDNAVLISLWLPVSAVCGWLADEVVTIVTSLVGRLSLHLAWRVVRPALFLAGLLGLTLAGCWLHMDIINPVTVLATADDLAAMSWVRDNVPQDALFAINTRVWQGTLHMGTDGGWWLPLLADRRVTLPAALYHLGAPEYVRQVNDLARMVEEAPSPADPAFVARLAEAGVTHVFVGARGGPLMPKDLDGSPYYRPVYIRGPERVYELAP